MAEVITNLASASDPAPSASANPAVLLPRVTIRFCTQCKWMLRAAYYAQELLSTFSTGLGEVALQPSTGGTFIVEILASVTPLLHHAPAAQPTQQRRVLWDRTVDGGFPETKELKRRVRDVIEPNRDLGHVDRDHAKKPKPAAATTDASSSEAPASSVLSTIATPQDSVLTSSPSSSAPTTTQETSRPEQSHPLMPVAASGRPASTAAPEKADGKGAGEVVCEDCQ
ncbi:selT/selW/selH selenoprotein domain-containing protein [Apiospora arundinis]